MPSYHYAFQPNRRSLLVIRIRSDSRALFSALFLHTPIIMQALKPVWTSCDGLSHDLDMQFSSTVTYKFSTKTINNFIMFHMSSTAVKFTDVQTPAQQYHFSLHIIIIIIIIIYIFISPIMVAINILTKITHTDTLTRTHTLYKHKELYANCPCCQTIYDRSLDTNS